MISFLCFICRHTIHAASHQHFGTLSINRTTIRMHNQINRFVIIVTGQFGFGQRFIHQRLVNARTSIEGIPFVTSNRWTSQIDANELGDIVREWCGVQKTQGSAQRMAHQFHFRPSIVFDNATNQRNAIPKYVIVHANGIVWRTTVTYLV